MMNLAARDALVRLIATLEDADVATLCVDALAALLIESNVSCADLPDGITFAQGRYTRHLLHRTEDFELLLLCWSPGSESTIHDHGGMRCAVKIVAGELEITDYLVLAGGDRPGYAHIAPVATTLAAAGEVDVRTPSRDLHRVRAGAEPAISLHVYAKPIDNFLIFDEPGRSCRMVASSYDSVLGLIG